MCVHTLKLRESDERRKGNTSGRSKRGANLEIDYLLILRFDLLFQRVFGGIGRWRRRRRRRRPARRFRRGGLLFRRSRVERPWTRVQEGAGAYGARSRGSEGESGGARRAGWGAQSERGRETERTLEHSALVTGTAWLACAEPESRKTRKGEVGDKGLDYGKYFVVAESGAFLHARLILLG